MKTNQVSHEVTISGYIAKCHLNWLYDGSLSNSLCGRVFHQYTPLERKTFVKKII